MAKGELLQRLAETEEEVLEELLEVAFSALNDIKTQERVSKELGKSLEYVDGATGVILALKDLSDDSVVDNWMPVRTKTDLATFIARVEAGDY